MPLKRCSVDGKQGWKWGDSGKCYTGPDAKQKAIKQGLAIEGPDNFKKKVKSCNVSEYDVVKALFDANVPGKFLVDVCNALELSGGVKYTTVSKEHFHTYYDGDAMTSFDESHAHPIQDGKVLPVEGHTHKLDMETE